MKNLDQKLREIGQNEIHFSLNKAIRLFALLDITIAYLYAINHQVLRPNGFFNTTQ